MNESLFVQYIETFFPKLQTIITRVNEKRTKEEALPYYHKNTSILRRVYSPDNKWKTTQVNTQYVAADYVAMDSPLPLKKRDTFRANSGELPKQGIKRKRGETDIKQLQIMELQGNSPEIVRALSNDAVFCSTGIDERNEYAFLKGLYDGCVDVRDSESTDGSIMRISYNYLDSHIFSTDEKDVLTINDLKKVINAADGDGNPITKIWIDKTLYDALRQTDGAKELAATYRGLTYTSATKLPVPIPSLFDEAFADETGGITFEKVNRKVLTEANGKRKYVKPFADEKGKSKRVILCSNTMLGALVYGRCAEADNRVEGVQYQEIDGYKLISQYSKNEPSLQEICSAQSFSLPIIEDTEGVYVLDLTGSQSVDEDAESTDTSDAYVTVFGNTYTKPEFIAVLQNYTTISDTATDAEVIEAVNQLNKSEQSDVKLLAKSYIKS